MIAAIYARKSAEQNVAKDGIALIFASAQAKRVINGVPSADEDDSREDAVQMS